MGCPSLHRFRVTVTMNATLDWRLVVGKDTSIIIVLMRAAKSLSCRALPMRLFPCSRPLIEKVCPP